MKKLGRVAAVALSATMLAGCGGAGKKTDTSTFRFAS